MVIEVDSSSKFVAIINVVMEADLAVVTQVAKVVRLSSSDFPSI